MWWKHQGGRELRDLLMLWWDPVGVYGIPEAITEYDGYTGQIGRLLREGATKSDVAAHFAELAPRFGMLPAPAGDDVAAAKVVDWFEQSMRRLGEMHPRLT